MKFAHKLSLAVILLLAVSLSAAGYFSIYQNFNVALQNAVEQNNTQHLLERYSLEADLLALRRQYTDLTDKQLEDFGKKLTSYVEGSASWQALYKEDLTQVYTSMPQDITAVVNTQWFNTDQKGYSLQQAGERRIMFFSSRVTREAQVFFLLSAYDVTPVFNERQRQLISTLQMDSIILVVATVVVLFISTRLTKPIRRLNITSQQIAGGAYNARSDVATDDEIGQLAAAFNKMAGAVEGQIEQLQLSVQQREDFVSAFTHEVKTPMTAIIGYSDIVRFQDPAPDVRQRAAQFIYRESKRLESLSQKLLMLMGLSEQKIVLLPIPLNTIFRDAVRSVYPVLQENNIEIKVLPVQGITVLADHDLLVDLLRNLILNAIKAEPRDNAVWLRWQVKNNRCRVAVIDNGMGIEEEQLARIIEPFYMVDKSRARRQGGSGVGLALSQKIAELHETSLSFHSEVGKGTLVFFELQCC